MQASGFNPDKIHDKLDEILKTASALNRKQYSHFYSFEEACAYFDGLKPLACIFHSPKKNQIT
jgi:hypothetical protein